MQRRGIRHAPFVQKGLKGARSNANPNLSPNPNPSPKPNPAPAPAPAPNQARAWVAELAPLQSAERKAGIAALPKEVRPAISNNILTKVGNSNAAKPIMTSLREEGSAEQVRFIKRSQEGATKPDLVREFGISQASVDRIRSEFIALGKITPPKPGKKRKIPPP